MSLPWACRRGFRDSDFGFPPFGWR